MYTFKYILLHNIYYIIYTFYNKRDWEKEKRDVQKFVPANIYVNGKPVSRTNLYKLQLMWGIINNEYRELYRSNVLTQEDGELVIGELVNDAEGKTPDSKFALPSFKSFMVVQYLYYIWLSL